MGHAQERGSVGQTEGYRGQMWVRLTVGPECRLELVLLKQDLVHGLLDGAEVEEGFCDDDAGVREVHLETRGHTASASR